MTSARRRSAWLALVVLPTCLICGTAQAQTCAARADRHAVAVSGEAYGDHDVVEEVAPGLRLALSRALWGWRVAVLDDAGDDLIPPSPMRGGLPEPREIYGWHFRNADNTGPNTGDVNAPQHERRFAFRLPSDETAASGEGRFDIEEFGLSGLEPGEQARMTYLRYSACLTWPKSDEEMRVEADAASLEFQPEDVEVMRACGLDADYALEATFPPRMLGGDFDGDGSLDSAAFVRRIADGRRGLAICRAGTWLDVLGVDRAVLGSPMEDDYLSKVEAWAVSTMADAAGGWDGEPPRPDAPGDVIVLERVEKALYSVYWDGAAFRSHQHYRYVEP